MKQLLNGVIIVSVIVLAILVASSAVSDTPFLTYVYSGSMKPVFQVNDAFFSLPSRNFQVGDIITFRPLTLKAELVTHRIYAVDGQGFVTKGDNNTYTDQSRGEPIVTTDRIVGKVVTLFDRPIVIPQLGLFSNLANKGLGQNVGLLSGVLIAAGVLNLAWGFFSPGRDKSRKPRRRLRLRDIYRLMSFIAVGVVLVSLLLGTRTSQIRYLVTDNPGTRGDQVALGQPGELDVTVKNQGFLPVWHFAKVDSAVAITKEPHWIAPLGQETLRIAVPPQAETGWKQIYIEGHSYPILAPRLIIQSLDAVSPWLAILLTGFLVYLYLTLFFALIQRIPGLEGWIPLKSFKDKTADRRIRRVKRWLMSGKRARS